MKTSLYQFCFIPAYAISWALILMEYLGKNVIQWQLSESFLFSYLESMKVTGLVQWGTVINSVFFLMVFVSLGLVATLISLIISNSIKYLVRSLFLAITNKIFNEV